MTGRSWYKDGLRFTCTHCSRCCRHESGYVFLSQRDLDRLASHFNITTQAVSARYCRVVHTSFGNRLSLREHSNLDCVLWKDGGCSVYESRPLQCRLYPFWPAAVASRQAWLEFAADCPGMLAGELHTEAHITALQRMRQAEPLLEPETP